MTGYKDNEYKETIDSEYKYLSDSKNYKNVNLGDVKTLTIGDDGAKKFYYQILTYEADSEYYEAKYQKAYVWYKLGEKNFFIVELELDSESKDEEITADIIRKFVSHIKVTNLK